MRTFLLAGLVLGSLGVAITSLQLSQRDASVALANSKRTGHAPAVSVKLFSHIKRRTVTYTLTIRNAAHAGAIRKKIPIMFTDIIPHGVKEIRAQGKYWDTKVHSKAGLSLVTGMYEGSYPIDPDTTLPPIIITGTITHAASKVLINSASVYVSGNTDQAHSNAVVSDNIASTLSSHYLLDIDDSCIKACNDLSSDDACSYTCDKQSVHVVVQKSVDISSEESVSNGTYHQQNTNNSGGSGNTTPNIPASPSGSPPGRGSVFPTMPNTGSDPQL
jgi:uncharacterized repeat protein (TIGR01451 family)